MQITLLTATLFPLSLRNYAKQTTTLTRCCALFLVSIPPLLSEMPPSFIGERTYWESHRFLWWLQQFFISLCYNQSKALYAPKIYCMLQRYESDLHSSSLLSP